MAVGELLVALNGYYEATGLYSFEFRRASGSQIAEIFFLLPPKSVSVGEPQKSDMIETLTGGYICDYGNAFKNISVAGESHFFYKGNTKFPAKIYPNTNEVRPNDFSDGFSEFLKLRFIVSRYRDYTMSKDGKLGRLPNFYGQTKQQVDALRKFVNSSVEDGTGALADRVRVIWHDYDYDDHFYVKIDNLDIKRGDDDVWSINYVITMRAYQIDSSKSTARIFNNMAYKKLSAPEHIRKVYLHTGEFHSASIPSTINIDSAGGTMPIKNITESEIDNTTLSEVTQQLPLPGGLL
jgi:hypothetical protein